MNTTTTNADNSSGGGPDRSAIGPLGDRAAAEPGNDDNRTAGGMGNRLEDRSWSGPEQGSAHRPQNGPAGRSWGNGRRPRRTRALSAVVAFGLVGAAGYGGYRLLDGDGDDLAAAPGAGVAADGTQSEAQADADPGQTYGTQAAEIRDLVETTRLSGALGYEDPITVVARANGSVSKAPKAGTATERGDVLYRIDGRPTVAFYGESAAWRDLRSGVAADVDIRQLEENLSALGHDPDQKLTIDNRWDANTTAAVKHWQRDLGVSDDGAVRLADLVFVPGPGEITGVEATRGAGVGDGTPMLRYQVHVDTDTVVAHRAGNVSELAPIGSTVVAGQPLFSINTKGTYGLIGDDLTNTRTLKAGVADGNDIRALEQNLVELGHDPESKITIDRQWDDATTDAVKRWETSLGLDESGVTTPALFQFVESDSVVTKHLIEIGKELDDPAAALEIGRTLRKIDSTISAADQDLVALGDPVTISLPGGGTTEGTIGEIATSATTGQDGEAEIALRIDATDPTAFGELVAAPVKVQIESKRTDGVLAVPTAALVGLVGGGHAVEVVAENGSRQLYAVELGATADGWIEITAGSLGEGQLVVVPR